MNGKILPSRAMYEEKTDRCPPSKVLFFPIKKQHKSNEKDPLALIDDILLPYIEKVKTGL